jgi:hypothetical protein
MAGYPKSGNLIPKALLRAFDPVEAAISRRVGFLETSFLAEGSEPSWFNPFWTFSEIDIILFFRKWVSSKGGGNDARIVI